MCVVCVRVSVCVPAFFLAWMPRSRPLTFSLENKTIELGPMYPLYIVFATFTSNLALGGSDNRDQNNLICEVFLDFLLFLGAPHFW